MNRRALLMAGLALLVSLAGCGGSSQEILSPTNTVDVESGVDETPRVSSPTPTSAPGNDRGTSNDESPSSDDTDVPRTDDAEADGGDDSADDGGTPSRNGSGDDGRDSDRDDRDDGEPGVSVSARATGSAW